MFTLIGEVYDQFDDGFEKIGEEFKKYASMSRPSAFNHAIIIKDNKFNSYPKYPIDSEENTKVSLEYFKKTAEKLPITCINKVAKRLAYAGEKYGVSISNSIQKYANMAKDYNPEYPVIYFTEEQVPAQRDFLMKKTASKLSYQERESLPDSAFGLVINQDGKKIRKFPMPDENHVRAAIKMYGKVYQDMPADQRSKLAKNIITKAKQYNIEISDDNPLKKYAEVKYYPENLHEIIEKRANMTKEASIKEGYKKLYKISSYYTPQQFTERLRQLDKLASLDKYYPIIGTPEEVMNSWMDQYEKDALIMPTLTELYSVANELQGILDKDTVEALLENPEIVWPDLPFEIQQFILDKIKEV
jgi:type III secretion system FlhB-like substrate exporter